MAKLNLNLTGHQITDEVLTRTSAAAAALEHDTILDDGTFEIWTAAGGTGTQLTETTDFVLGSKDTEYTTLAGNDVWTTLAIVNGTYQNIDLYITYKTVGDYADAADVGLLFADYDISAANQGYTLPSAKLAGAQGIRISWSGGNGTYKLTITGTINGFTNWFGHYSGSMTIYSNGVAWYTDADSIEYASNSSVADASDTTSFVYGPGGSSAGFTFTAARVRQVRFLRPILPNDVLTLQFYDSTTGNWLDNGILALGGAGQIIASNGATGALLYYIAAAVPNTDVTVFFFQYRQATSNWVTNMTGLKWRVRKLSKGCGV